MAIVLQPQFPVPDRSRQPVRILKDENGMIDIGWCEGVLSDGRAFRAEMWAQDQVSSLTIFFKASTASKMTSTSTAPTLRSPERIISRRLSASWAVAPTVRAPMAIALPLMV